LFFERRRKNNNQPVRQWLGVVVGIAIVLLLTLPLPLPYCVASFCRHSVQLRYASCNVHVVSLQWRLHCALCRGIFLVCHAKGCHDDVLGDTALFFVPQ